MIKALIFDFDGVIVESVDIKTNGFAYIFAGEGRGAVAKIISYHRANSGVSRFEKIKFIYQNILHRGLDNNKYEELCQKFSDFVTVEVVRSAYVPGAKEFLDNHRNKLKFFVISATPQIELQEIIRRRNIHGYFTKIYGAPLKKKEVVKEILAISHLMPKEAAYVGDALADYEAAISNSVHFIARINDNYSLFADKTCLKINDLNGLEGAINALSTID